jgi:CopG family nickel-responsive transcriptional regulator
MVVVSITLPPELLKKIDKLVETRGYYSRSEAFRDAIRSIIEETEYLREDADKAASTIMVIYENPRKDIDRKLTDLRHEYDDIIIENLHRHIGKEHCLEILITEGKINRIRSLIGRIRGLRGIQQVKVVYISI